MDLIFEILRGYFFIFSLTVCLAGLTFRFVYYFFISENTSIKTLIPLKRKISLLSGTGISRLLRGLYFPAVVSAVFHILLFFVPIFLKSHWIMIYESAGVDFFYPPENVSDFLTVIFLAAAFILLMRRIFDRKVRMLNTPLDTFLLAATLLPFLTGFLAYHQIGDYRAVMLLHLASGNILLILTGITKLGHMPFAVFSWFFIKSDNSVLGGRSWK